MELHHLRCFLAVAEERRFGPAAARLGMEPSSLSRIIKRLESTLDVQLFNRAPSGTRLTRAGEVFLADAKRVLLAVEQAKSNAQATASGYTDRLRIAVSDGILPRRLTALLARSRIEEPELEIRIFEVRLADQLKGLRDDLYDAGFARSSGAGGEAIVATAAWEDPLLAVLPARHQLLSYSTVPIGKLLEHPLILCNPEACAGDYHQINLILRSTEQEPTVTSQATSHEVMFALVAAGYGIGLACHEQFAACHRSEIVMRPLEGASPNLVTYLLRPDKPPNEPLNRFIRRALADSTHADSHHSHTQP